MTWDIIEFVTICSRRGRGLPPKIHVWADSFIFIGAAAGTGIVVVQIIGEAMDQSQLYLLTGQVIEASILVALMSVQPFFATRASTFVREDLLTRPLGFYTRFSSSSSSATAWREKSGRTRRLGSCIYLRANRSSCFRSHAQPSPRTSNRQ